MIRGNPLLKLTQIMCQTVQKHVLIMKARTSTLETKQIMTGTPVGCRDSRHAQGHEQTMPNQVNMDCRIPGLPHSVVKQAQNSRVRELVKNIENHPHRHALQQDLQQNKACNPFSAKSKQMIQDVGNVLFELFNTEHQWENLLTSTKRCPHQTVYNEKLEDNSGPCLVGSTNNGTIIKFSFHLVASRMQAKVCDRTEQPVVHRALAKTSDEWFSRIHSNMLQANRSQLTVVCCNRRRVQKQHLKQHVFAVWISTKNHVQVKIEQIFTVTKKKIDDIQHPVKHNNMLKLSFSSSLFVVS